MMSASRKAGIAAIAFVGMMLIVAGITTLIVMDSAPPAAPPGEPLMPVRSPPPFDTTAPEMLRVYALQQGENAKWVHPAEFPEERKLYGDPFVNGEVDDHLSFVLRWDAKPSTLSFHGLGGGMSVGEIVRTALGGDVQLEMSDTIRDREIGGDWVLRGVPGEKTAVSPDAPHAVLEIFRKELNLSLALRSEEVPRDVIFVRGSMAPLPEENKGVIELAVPGHPSATADYPSLDGDSGLFKYLLGEVRFRTRLRVVDESSAGEVRLKWQPYRSFTSARFTEDLSLVDALLAHLSSQTGLEFTREQRVVTVWFLTEAAQDGQ